MRVSYNNAHSVLSFHCARLSDISVSNREKGGLEAGVSCGCVQGAFLCCVVRV